MLDKYFLSCLVFTLVKNAVGEISLDYYFGFDDALRSTKYMANCNSNGMRDSCQARCGSNHACLLGKCFCVEMKPQLKDDVFEKLFSKSEALKKEESSEENSSSESESEERGPTKMGLAELAQRPTLRHHIAHFCPNLDIARKCIHKCMLRNKPAFCGKDHVCYCGHKYDRGLANDDESGELDGYGVFRDLYTKYFGPQPESEERTSKSKSRTIQ